MQMFCHQPSLAENDRSILMQLFSRVPAENYFHRKLCVHFFLERLLQETGAQDGSKTQLEQNTSRSRPNDTNHRKVAFFQNKIDMFNESSGQFKTFNSVSTIPIGVATAFIPLFHYTINSKSHWCSYMTLTSHLLTLGLADFAIIKTSCNIIFDCYYHQGTTQSSQEHVTF